jgi:hypothetical protein
MTFDKRLKKFNKFYNIYSSNPYYEKIKELYSNDIIKTVTSVDKLFKKIKVTKKNQLYKSSKKFADEIDVKYNKFSLKHNILNKKTTEINEDNIDNFNRWIHESQFIDLQRTNKKAYYIQTVKFLNYLHEPINPFETIKLKTNRLLKGQYRKDFWQYINIHVNANSYEWKVEEWTRSPKKYHTKGSRYQNGNYVIIETIAYKKVEIVQKIYNTIYEDNETLTCVYDGFLEFFKSDCKMKKAVYNKLIKNKDTYAKGYTDETLKEICDFTNSSLTIKDLISGKDKIIYAKNARYNIEFLNTKYNHLDLLTHSYKNIVELANYKEYNKIKNSLNFYIEKMGQLITLDTIYKVKDDAFKIIYKEWKEKINYNDLMIDENNDEFKLIDCYDYSTHCFFNNFEINNELYDELDIEKAYFNYANKTKNPNYHGVPSGSFINFKWNDNDTIETFNKQLENNLIGFYQVTIKKINNHINLYEKIGILENNTYVFTSVQINAFKEDIIFQFLNYSVSIGVDIPFTEDFKTKCDGLNMYCKAYGLLMAVNDYISVTVKPLVCDLKYYSVISDENLNMYESDGLIHINNKTDIIKTGRHIAKYIHSYTKTLIFQQLKEVNIEDVFGVKIDSIVIKKNAMIKNILPCFHQNFKECKIETMLKTREQRNNFINLVCGKENVYIDELDGHLTYNDGCTGYFRPLFTNTEETINFNLSFLPNNEAITSNIIFMSGKGGSGKSHSILSNLKDICMVSSCWNLTQAKKEE